MDLQHAAAGEDTPLSIAVTSPPSAFDRWVLRYAVRPSFAMSGS